MKYLMGLILIIVGCSTTPRPDVSKFDPRLFDALSSVTWHVDNLPNQSQGTAFAINVFGHALMVTNAHVCGGLMGISGALIGVNQKTGKQVLTRVLLVDETNDLCITSAPYMQGPDGAYYEITIPSITTSLGVDDALEGRGIGRTYLSGGHPGGGPFAFQTFVDIGDGEITLPRENAYCQVVLKQKDVSKEIQQECNVTRKEIVMKKSCIPGQSGSPVINNEGHLIGIVQATDMWENKCYAVSAEHLIEDLRELLLK